MWSCPKSSFIIKIMRRSHKIETLAEMADAYPVERGDGTADRQSDAKKQQSNFRAIPDRAAADAYPIEQADHADRLEIRANDAPRTDAETGIDWPTVLGSATRWALYFGGCTLVLRRLKCLRLHDTQLSIESGSRIVAATHAAWVSHRAFSMCPQLLRFWKPAGYMLSIGHRPSTRAERSVLESSLGYFLWDSLYLLVEEPDPLFLVHHVSIITECITCLTHGRGERVIFAALAYGELTGPLLNLWWLSKRSQRPQLARRASRLFTILFLLIRLGIFPAFCTRYVQSVLSGDMGAMVGSERLARLWAVINVLAVAGGAVWSKALVAGYLTDVRRARKNQ